MMKKMMTNKAYHLSNYSFRKGESLLFDANVWLYLFPAPIGVVYRHAATYSRGLKSMRYAGVELIIDVLVLSEYLNRYCRIVWNADHKWKYPDFKDFRKSSDFVAPGRSAVSAARQILKLSRRVDHPFAQTNIGQVLAGFEAGTSDLNDGLLADTCRRNGWKLVTNDADFTTGGIEVLTTNPMLLRACP